MPTVDLPGRGTVAYRWSGEGTETVVLVNGTAFNFHQWDLRALPILQQGLAGRYRFLQYDYVGIGGSSCKTAPFRMLDLADELRDLLDALSVDRVHLMGVSKGSMVSQAFLIRHRERALSFCGLGNPNLVSEHLEPSFLQFCERLEALQALQDIWPERINRDNYARVFNQVYVPLVFLKQCEDLTLLERARAAILRRMLYPTLEGTFIQSMVDLFEYYTGEIMLEAPVFAEGLPKVRGVPILLLNGTADTTTPIGMSRELAALLPEAELIELEGVTHMGPMALKKEAVPVFEQYIAFMNDG